MSVETQRKNIVHRILDIENSQLLNQIEELLNNNIYTYTTSGKPLSAKEYKNHLFLPFSDVTNGKESYIGGRYIDMEIQDAKVWEIDFNKAYSPPCAFTAFATCPLPPKQNVLNLSVTAGEKKYSDEDH